MSVPLQRTEIFGNVIRLVKLNILTIYFSFTEYTLRRIAIRALNLDQLRTLVTIVDLGSFAAASRSLHLAPPTVSLHISELESRLGVALLLRTNKAVVPTRIGEAFILKARRLLSDSDALLEEVNRHLNGGVGRVKIGASTGALAHLLPKALQIVGSEHSGIDVQVAVLTSQDTLEKLRLGTLDIGIVALPQASVTGLNVVAWRRDPILAFVPSSWITPKSVSPRWMANKPLILNDSSTRLNRMTIDWFAAAGITPTPKIELNYNDAMKSLVAAGYGAALLPVEANELTRENTFERSGMATVPLVPKLWRPLGLAYRAGPLEPATRTVLNVLTKLGQKPNQKLSLS
jgi:DNA-binding transcriptional LysR family regulator